MKHSHFLLLVIVLCCMFSLNNATVSDKVEVTSDLLPENINKKEYISRVNELIASKKKELSNVNEALITSTILSKASDKIGNMAEYTQVVKTTVEELKKVKSTLEYELNFLERICLADTCTSESVAVQFGTAAATTQSVKTITLQIPPPEVVSKPPVNPPCASKAVPLHRYFSSSKIDHLYTVNFAENQSLLQSSYKYEGEECTILDKQVAGTTALYKYTSGSDTFLTTGMGEVSGNPQWVFKGILGYCYTKKEAGTTELYRYYSSGGTDHFYTTNFAELGKGKSGYAFEGVQCYVLPKESKGKCY